MKDKLVEFETAKLAEEKNCNLIYNKIKISTFSRWNDANEFCNKYEGKLNDDSFIITNYGCDEHGGNYTCLITLNEYDNLPTQSLLQKWLRETHNIYVASYHDLTADGKGIQFYTNWGFLQPKGIEGKGGYDEYNEWKTYEEALEFGLLEGLKMIIKNNLNK